VLWVVYLLQLLDVTAVVVEQRGSVFGEKQVLAMHRGLVSS
jgi:hypothetical protein